MSRPRPRKNAPALKVPTLGGGVWSLNRCAIDNFLMIVFYRHKNCGICQSYLKELAARNQELGTLGVATIAISMDDAEGTQTMLQTLPSADIRFGYGLCPETAKAWGLYLSRARKDTEPALFSEPGLFLIDREKKLFFVSTQSMPFGRPELKSLIEWLPKVIEQSIPARGEYQLGES